MTRLRYACAALLASGLLLVASLGGDALARRNGGGRGAVAALADNIASAFVLHEDTQNYLDIDTLNGSEKIDLGNTTTNPAFNFLGTGAVTFGGPVVIGSGRKFSATLLTSVSSPYTLLTTDWRVTLTTAGGAIVVNLPDPTVVGSQEWKFKDVGGTLSANSLTLQRFGAETIDGIAADKVITSNKAALTIFSDGTNWWVE